MLKGSPKCNADACKMSNLPQQQSLGICKCYACAPHEGEEGFVTYVLRHKAIRTVFSEAWTVGYILGQQFISFWAHQAGLFVLFEL